MNNNNGIFTISLDFELYWGMRDIISIDEYKTHLLGAREAIPYMLDTFKKYNVHATWATVGLLFFKDTNHLKQHLPETTPQYHQENLSPYDYITNTEANKAELDTAYHYAPELIKDINNTMGQEVATHTFSHYYCREEGQTLTDFKNDIAMAITIAKQKGIEIKSLVFPRNQWNPDYLAALGTLGVQSFRGTEASWMYQASNYKGQLNSLNRAARLLDAYINISGHNTYTLADCTTHKPFNFPSSRQLRPYSKKLAFLEGLRLNRIKNSMTYAAKNNEIFHLWWHPHNFGVDREQNMMFLEKLMQHYSKLQTAYNMQSLNMAELSSLKLDSINFTYNN